MNSRNRHLQYRKSIYRKRRIRAILISSAVAVILAFALFMIIGTALHSQSNQPYSSDPEDTGNNETEQTLPSASTVGAYALPLLEDGSNFSARLDAISETANAVCINLNSADGTLLYRSELASSLSHLTVHGDASSLSGALTSIERNGFHASAVLYLPSFDSENDLLTDVELATWGAITCEALREGVGDVLLIAQDMETEDIKKVCSLADSIHSTVDGAIIGIAIPEAVLADEDSVALIDTLSKHFNYMALDTTTYKSDDDPLSFIEGKISSLQLELMYYKMRVLLPRDNDAEIQQKYVDAVTKYNISSWQILP